MTEITQTLVQHHLKYNPETGKFIWLRGRRAGYLAGSEGTNGYIKIQLLGVHCLAHRLAWLYMYGKFPDNFIDHINGVKADNRIVNLRDATASENRQNQRKGNIGTKSGLLGVYPSGRRWMALIHVDHQHRYLGTYDTREEAHQKYLEAKRAHHPAGTL